MHFQRSLSKNHDIWALASTLSLCFGLALSSVSALAAAGGSDRGGGDTCEDRIKIIRDDLKVWIQNGGPAGLNLPAGISAQQYSDQMLASLNSAKISCVGPSDPGYPVKVEGTPKVCKFEKDWFDNQKITCDFGKFETMTEPDQYLLIHHEYAGLSRFELPNGADSHYEISNQISTYLVNQVTLKLAVKIGHDGVITGDYLKNTKTLLSEALTWGAPSNLRDTCRLIAGGVVYQDSIAEGILDAMNRAIVYDVTSARLDTSEQGPLLTLTGPNHIEPSRFHEEIVVKLSPDFKTVMGIKYTKLEYKEDLSGDIVHPVQTRGFVPNSITECGSF